MFVVLIRDGRTQSICTLFGRWGRTALHFVKELGLGVTVEREGGRRTVEVCVIHAGGERKGIDEGRMEVEVKATENRFFGKPITGTQWARGGRTASANWRVGMSWRVGSACALRDIGIIVGVGECTFK
jgi:hypothetical protein